LELAPFSFLRGCQGFTGPFLLPFLISKIKELAQKYNGLLVSGKFDLLCKCWKKPGSLRIKPMKFGNFAEQELLNANGKQLAKITGEQDFYEVISK
jgi:hypothetical protein